MNIKLMQVGPIGTNCYILEHDNKIAVIDRSEEHTSELQSPS